MLLGDEPILRWVLDRARRIPGTTGAVIATSLERKDDPIAAYCERHDMPVFRGSETDVLERFVACARAQRADAAVRVTGDCPLLDPGHSGRVVAAFQQTVNCSYAANISPRVVPDGLDTEVISMSALEASWREASIPGDREHVTPFVRRQPGRFPAVAVDGPPIAPERRLTLDTLSDFVVLSALAHRLRSRGLVGNLQEVLGILDEPDMAELIGQAA